MSLAIKDYFNGLLLFHDRNVHTFNVIHNMINALAVTGQHKNPTDDGAIFN